MSNTEIRDHETQIMLAERDAINLLHRVVTAKTEDDIASSAQLDAARDILHHVRMK